MRGIKARQESKAVQVAPGQGGSVQDAWLGRGSVCPGQQERERKREAVLGRGGSSLKMNVQPIHDDVYSVHILAVWRKEAALGTQTSETGGAHTLAKGRPLGLEQA